ncbi:MAG TPA: nitrilase-related carbon-nitrogen hydrolase [Tepidisphaeraceae bacterium]
MTITDRRDEMMLTVALGQMAVATAGPEANLAKAGVLAGEAKGRGAELLCLPEMFTTGFQWEKNIALRERMESDVARVAEIARENSIWINGSMALPASGGLLANTSILFGPSGERVASYRKMHLFRLMGEHEHVTPGTELVTADAPWGRTGLAVCYDLRFPELFGAYALRGVQLQLLPAAWPEARLEHWQILIRARAIENQVFVLATNQCGEESFDAEGITRYAGRSAVIDPWGRTITEGGAGEELIIATIDLAEVQRVRAKIDVQQDRRSGRYS